MNHDIGVRIDNRQHAVQEFRARAKYRARDTVTFMLLGGTRIDQQGGFATPLPTMQFCRGHRRRGTGLFDEFAESLARHAAAGKQLPAAGFPGADTAVEDGKPGITEGLQQLRGRACLASAGVV